MDGEQTHVSEDGNLVESSSGREEGPVIESGPCLEPFVGMEFESEEAAQAFYGVYATRVGFVMRLDEFRRSTHEGEVVWRMLVCDRKGIQRSRQKGTVKNGKPRVITRAGGKASIVVELEKEKSGKWVVTEFVKEHNHPLVVAPAYSPNVLPSQTPDEKDVKIQELTAELQRERKRSSAYLEQLHTILRDMEEHSGHLLRNIDDVVWTLREIESNRTTF
ncbi:protein FAR-RED IMPAIRED RESPONSE 1-like [Punica granatum]|nr:protein FAR-RED IMPAIRED RESPONSE 1-like [Punica granatum]